jgi:hypothetical protein
VNFHAPARQYTPSGSDTRVCLSVDAISQKVHVLIDPHAGEITGLTKPLMLDRETVDFLKNNSDAFAQFVGEHAHILAKFFCFLFDAAGSTGESFSDGNSALGARASNIRHSFGFFHCAPNHE